MTGSFPALTDKLADSYAQRGCIAGAAERQRGYTESYPKGARPARRDGRYECKFNGCEPARRRLYAARARHAVPLRSAIE